MTENNLTKLARVLRKNQTPQEAILWQLLGSRQFSDYKFRRQLTIDKYIVDFCCLRNRLIIELDGGQHNQNRNVAKDRIRDKYLPDQGFTILGIWNNEITENLDGVAEKILNLLGD